MRTYRSAILGLLVAASVAVAFIQLDDTNVQTILAAATKTFEGAIRFQATGGGTEYVGITAPSVVNTPSVTYKLPQNDGTAGQALVTNGSATLSFATVSTPPPTATPQSTATPQATATPLIDLLYSGKLNMGADAAGTPLGRVNITAAATPAPHDREIICTVGTATPTPAIYTMPAATGSGRVIDMIVAGAGPCQMNAGSDLMNDGHAEDFLANGKWRADTCQDIASGQWACRNMGTPTPTP